MDEHDVESAIAEIEGRTSKPPAKTDDTHPPAGPHAMEELTSHDATPGAGALPDVGRDAADVDGGAG